MLLFILTGRHIRLQRKNFNTTLVTVYRICRTILEGLITISIQLLLLFILLSLLYLSDPLQFQYNSCYCLSCAFFTLSQVFHFNTTLVTVYLCVLYHTVSPPPNFNTTLVTVYHGVPHAAIVGHIFQYNSCYCLSSRFTRRL